MIYYTKQNNILQVFDTLVYHATKLQIWFQPFTSKEQVIAEHENLLLCRKKTLCLRFSQRPAGGRHVPSSSIQASWEPQPPARLLLPAPAHVQQEARWTHSSLRTPLEADNHCSLSFLHRASLIISQVPDLTCSATAHISPNSPFLLNQHNFRISLLIVSNTDTNSFAGSFPSPHHQNYPNIPPLLISLQHLWECPPGSTPSSDPSAPKSTVPKWPLPRCPKYWSHPSFLPISNANPPGN